MRSQVLTAAAIWLLASCSEHHAPTSSRRSQSVSPVAEHPAPVTLPDPSAWKEIAIPEFGYSLRLPDGVHLGDAGHEGAYLNMKSGYQVWISSGTEDRVDEDKKFYASGPSGTLQTMLAEPDAILVHRVEGGKIGAYCEVTSCKKFDTRFVCVFHDGAKVQEEGEVQKLTEDECRALIVAVRSLKKM